MAHPATYIGKIVEIVFVDHVSSGDEATELVLCKVWGRVVSETWQKVAICTWESDTDGNNEYTTLIRSAIHSIRSMIVGEE